MKFNGNVVGKIFLVLLCLILGAVLGLGGLAGGIYYVVTKKTVGSIYDDYVEKNLKDETKKNIEFGDEVRDMTILNWGKEIVNKVTDMDKATIGDIESLVGYKAISSALNSVIGLDGEELEKVRASSLTNLGETITSVMTVEKVQEKFGVKFPDLPLFEDKEFLKTPLSEAFGDLDQKPLSMFIDTGEETHAVINAIKDLSISDLGTEKLNEKINSLKLSEVLTDISEENKVLTALKNKTIAELSGEGSGDIINSLFFDEIMTIDENSKPLMKGLRYATLESVTVEIDKITGAQEDEEFKKSDAYAEYKFLEVEGYEYIYAQDGTAYVYVIEDGEKKEGSTSNTYLCYKTKLYGNMNRPLVGVDTTVYELPIKDIVEIDEDDKLMNGLKDSTLNTIADDINKLFFDEIMTINEDSKPLMKGLKYATLESKTVEIDKATGEQEDKEFRESAKYAEAEAREVEGYEYIYAKDGTAYVYVIEDGVKKEGATADTYICYETKLYAEKNRPLIGVDEVVYTLPLKQIVEIGEDDKLMKALEDSTLDTLSDDINTLFLDQIMTIDENSSKTIIALKYSSLTTVTETIAGSKFEEVYSEPEKELPGYVYKYVNDGETYIPYVLQFDDYGEPVKYEEGAFVVVKAREYDGFYRPMVSIDEKIGELLIAELIESPSSQTLKSLVGSSLDSKYAYIENDALRAAETTEEEAQQLDGFTYKYSKTYGVPYIVVVDEDGNAITEAEGRTKLYKTKYYNEKFYPLRGLDDKINELTFGEVVEIDENSSPLVKSLENAKVNKMDETVNKLFFAEMMTIEDDSATVLKSIKYNALQSAIAYIETNNAVEDNAEGVTGEMRDKQLSEYTYVYYEVKGKLTPYVCILTEDGRRTTETVNGETCYKTYETKEYGGQYYPIISIDEKLKDLSLSDVFSEEQLDEGILSMLDSTTKIDDIGDAVADKIQTSSLARLGGVGVIDTTGDKYNMENTPKEQRAFIWNNNLGGMLEGLIDFVNNPLDTTGAVPTVNYNAISEEKKNLPAGKYSLSEFVEKYNQYDTINLQGNVTVNIDAAAAKYSIDDTYYIPVFNLDGNKYETSTTYDPIGGATTTITLNAGYTLTFTGGNVVLAVLETATSTDETIGEETVSITLDEDGKVIRSKQQYYYAYDASNGGAGSELKYYDGTTEVKTGTSVDDPEAGKTVPEDNKFIEYKKIG